MSWSIDYETTRDALKKVPVWNPEDRHRMLQCLADQPPADRHGHWIRQEDGTMACSLCGEGHCGLSRYMPNYCEDCGARMSGTPDLTLGRPDYEVNHYDIF